MWPGLDGLDGPFLTGTCFVIKRVALYGSFVQEGKALIDYIYIYIYIYI